jgi:hypothetical protein
MKDAAATLVLLQHGNLAAMEMFSQMPKPN